MNILIAVPTFDRSELFISNRGTVKWLKEFKKYVDVKLFIKDNEEQIKKYEDLIFDNLPVSYDWISEKKLVIIEYAIMHNYTYLILMDDDLTFYKRFENYVSKCKVLSSPEDIEQNAMNIIWKLTRLCNDKYPMTGLPFRKDMRVKKYMFEKNNKLIQCVCLYLPVIKELLKRKRDYDLLNNIRFKEDYCLQLLLLTQNYRTLTYNGYCYQDFGQNSKGGCYQSRTIEEFEKSSKVLYQEFKHTKNISLRMKKTNNPNWLKNQMLEVKINWKGFLDKNEKPYLTEDEIKNV
jgi:hypothetical protein